MRKVAVAQVAQNAGGESKESLSDLTFRVSKEVLDKSDIKRKEIDSVILVGSDIFHSGLSCANAYDWDGAGGYMKNGSRCEESLMALAYGMMRIMTGDYDTVLITSIVKGSENPDYEITSQYFSDPFYQRPVGINETTAAGLQMKAYMNAYGITEEQCAKVVVKNLGNAIFNPYAHIKKRVTVEDILKSDIVSYPLKAMECGPKSDGIVSALLCSEEKVRKLTNKPVWIKGYGSAMDRTNIGDRDLLNTSLKLATRRAYEMASISNPRKEIDLAEISEPYAFQELLWLEQMGLCDAGQGGKFIDSGMTRTNGKFPVNASGGVLANNPYVSRGLQRVVEAVLQIRRDAGEHQVDRPVKTAVVQSTQGCAGQFNAVAILEG
jgi:acetyl-CoA C-acetyltransferase